MALTHIEMLIVIIRNQTKALVFSVVRRKSETAKETLVRESAVRVAVARESRVRVKCVTSEAVVIAMSYEWWPSWKLWTRIVVRMQTTTQQAWKRVSPFTCFVLFAAE